MPHWRICQPTISPETDDIAAGEIALYIFTSGTTGLPKPAVIYHRKIMSAAKPYSTVGFHAKPSDRMYICLPLYHATGFLLGIGSCLYSGASMFVRRRFSATQFWPEVQKHQTTLFVYVGELCRYLAMAPECPDEKNNPLKTMLGNGCARISGIPFAIALALSALPKSMAPVKAMCRS